MELPKEFEKIMMDMLGAEYPLFKESFEKEDMTASIRITKKSAEKKILSLLSHSEKIPWCENGYYVDKAEINGRHPYHIAGAVYFQEASAMSSVSALPIEKGDFVLDLCAAPGGKATQVAEKMEGEGLLVANEIVSKRAEILAENIERLGIKNAIITNENPERLAEKFPEFFDKIIVDAPCSGEGMFRKEPQAIDEWSVEHTKSCSTRQKHILDSAIKMLCPGGYLVYSTCTFSYVENEENAEYVLKNYPEMTLAPITLSGLSDGIGMPFAKRIFPHREKGEGHFVALFKKSGEAEGRKTQVSNEPPELFREFEKKTFNISHKGFFRTFGDHLYLLPFDINLDRIKVIRAGLYMGELKKGRFEPSSALALASKREDFLNTLDFSLSDDNLQKYLKGDIIVADKSGWCAVLVDSYPLGWGKASRGILKNHFPKKYRLIN